MMPSLNSSWKKLPIKDVWLEFHDGPHATPKPAGSGPIYLGIKNISEDGHLDLSEIRYISEEDYPKWTKKVEPRPGDIVFTYEATLNRYAIIPEGFRGCLGRRLALIRPNSERIDTKFLFYYFFGREWRATIQSKIIQGSTVDRIPIITFPDFEISLPPLPTQRKIADILSAYDDLIENNARRIKILEEMAQTIYRKWFVHFRFPGHEQVAMVETELGWIPEGWQSKEVKNIVHRLASGTTYTAKDISDKGRVPVIDQSRGEFLGYHNGRPDQQATILAPILVFGDHTCRMRLMIEPFSVGPNVVAFVGTDEIPAMYLYHLLRGLVHTREYKRHWTELISKKVIVAPYELSVVFCDTVTPMVKTATTLTSKNLVLKRTRDLLLPKLVSGEVDVSQLHPP